MWVDQMQNNLVVLIVMLTVMLPSTANTVLAAEKYACVEEDKVGFQRPAMKIMRFYQDKFILTYDPTTDKIFASDLFIPDAPGNKCVSNPSDEEITCLAANGAITLVFNPKTREFASSLVQTSEDDVYVSYGRCEKF